MAIVKMKRLRLAAMKQDREELLELLQRMGCVEIDEPSPDPEDPNWALLSRPGEEGLAAAREGRTAAERALSVLKKYAPEKSAMLSARPAVSREELLDPNRQAQAAAQTETINKLDRRMAAIHAEIIKKNAELQALSPWLPLELPLETQSTAQVNIAFGTLPLQADADAACAAVVQASELVQLTKVSEDRERQYFLLLCHNSQKEAVLEALKSFGWSRANLRGWTGTAADNARRLEQETAELERELDGIQCELAQLGQQRENIRALSDRYGAQAAREESRNRALDTEQVFFLDGWVPEEDWPQLERALGRYLCVYEAREPLPEEYPNVPVKLKNNFLTRCMNVVTEMYSLPAYDGTDPNPLMAPFFILFFGIMMADMAYGILMVVGALFVLKKTRPREGTRNFMELVLWCGISTFIVGAMTGGFFGDFIPQLAEIVAPGSNVTLPALFTPLDDTVAIMLGSLVLGAIQVFTGMTVSIINKIRAGDFIDALFDEITWWIILGGAGLAIFGIGTVSGVPVVLAAGCLMLVFGGTRQAKGFGKVSKLVGLVYNGVTGFFSDILSYVRLMALMLSGSVIAQVFNTLAATFGNVVLFILISMIGNALNLALNLLGCYVHDLRLQCLEFFNRFYKEGGRPYRPLAYQTKYVDVIKEEQ